MRESSHWLKALYGAALASVVAGLLSGCMVGPQIQTPGISGTTSLPWRRRRIHQQ